MSYRLYLFDSGDSTTVAAAHAWLDAQERALVDGTPTRGTTPAWLDQLRGALGRRHPDLQPEAVPAGMDCAPYAVLADAEDGVEISLYGDSVVLTIPFWHTGERAEHVMQRVFDYLKTARDVTGYVIYDPQLDAVVQPEADLPRALERYSGATRRLRGHGL